MPISAKTFNRRLGLPGDARFRARFFLPSDPLDLPTTIFLVLVEQPNDIYTISRHLHKIRDHHAPVVRFEGERIDDLFNGFEIPNGRDSGVSLINPRTRRRSFPRSPCAPPSRCSLEHLALASRLSRSLALSRRKEPVVVFEKRARLRNSQATIVSSGDARSSRPSLSSTSISVSSAHSICAFIAHIALARSTPQPQIVRSHGSKR